MRVEKVATVRDNQNLWTAMSSLWSEFCGEDCLHGGFHESTDCVADTLGLAESDLVLEVCSGLGGSSNYLASKIGCRLVGLEVTESSVLHATKRARELGVDTLVEFHVGNALDMPFPSNQFHAAFSEDSLCHVTDKGRAVEETARVLKPGGRFCLRDYTWSGEGDISDEFLRDVCAPIAWPYLETLQGYMEIFDRCGMRLVSKEDETHILTDSRKANADLWAEKQDYLMQTYGAETIGGMASYNQALYEHVEMGNMRSWMFLLEKQA